MISVSPPGTPGTWTQGEEEEEEEEEGAQGRGQVVQCPSMFFS